MLQQLYGGIPTTPRCHGGLRVVAGQSSCPGPTRAHWHMAMGAWSRYLAPGGRRCLCPPADLAWAVLLVTTTYSHAQPVAQTREYLPLTHWQRAWLVNNLKVRTAIAMRATNLNLKLNAQVQLTNLQIMDERGTATSDQRRQLDLEYQDWARLQGRGPPHWHTAGAGRAAMGATATSAGRSNRNLKGPGPGVTVPAVPNQGECRCRFGLI